MNLPWKSLLHSTFQLKVELRAAFQPPCFVIERRKTLLNPKNASKALGFLLGQQCLAGWHPTCTLPDIL